MYKNSRNPVTPQLALAIQLNDEATLSDFSWGENSLLHQQLLNLPLERQIYLWGPSGCGKSHLLQACCQISQSAIYLPLKLLNDWGPEILEDLETHDLICIDDIDVIAGNSSWEEGLFHLYNRARDNEQTSLLISGTTAPIYLSHQLADLRSRLSWGLVTQVLELSDADKIKTLQLRAHQRGFELSSTVGHFILNRCGRNMHDLKAILDSLDSASWVLQKKITIPFVKRVLGL